MKPQTIAVVLLSMIVFFCLPVLHGAGSPECQGNYKEEHMSGDPLELTIYQENPGQKKIKIFADIKNKSSRAITLIRDFHVFCEGYSDVGRITLFDEKGGVIKHSDLRDKLPSTSRPITRENLPPEKFIKELKPGESLKYPIFELDLKDDNRLARQKDILYITWDLRSYRPVRARMVYEYRIEKSRLPKDYFPASLWEGVLKSNELIFMVP